MNFFNDYGQEPLGCTHPVSEGETCSYCPKPEAVNELTKMLALRKELDPDAPDIIVFSESDRRATVPTVRELYLIEEHQRLVGMVVDAAIDWYKSDTDTVERWPEKAEALGTAIEALLDFRRRMPMPPRGHIGAKWIGMTLDGEQYTPE